MADIVSPIPGVFYSTPGPDKPPFVQVGDAVTVGQAIGIIEVMKQFTELQSDTAGRLAELRVEHGAMVMPGDVIAVVEEG